MFSYIKERRKQMAAQMIQSLSELKAHYKINEIISALEKNLEAHKIDYAKALKVWRHDALAAMEALLDKHMRDSNFTEIAYGSITTLRPPVDCADGYKKAITLFKQMQGETIELDFSTANSVFNDDWSWATAAKLVNNSYSSRMM